MAILVEAKGAHEGLKAIRVGEEENRTVTGGTLSLRCHGDYKLTYISNKAIHMRYKNMKIQNVLQI